MRTLFKKMGWVKKSGGIDYEEIRFDVIFIVGVSALIYIAILLKGVYSGI